MKSSTSVDLQSIHHGFGFNLTSHTRGSLLREIKQTWPNRLMWFAAVVHLLVRYVCCWGKFGLNGSDYATRQIQIKWIFFYCRSPRIGTFIFKDCDNSYYFTLSSSFFPVCHCTCEQMGRNTWAEESCGEMERTIVEWTCSGLRLVGLMSICVISQLLFNHQNTLHVVLLCTEADTFSNCLRYTGCFSFHKGWRCIIRILLQLLTLKIGSHAFFLPSPPRPFLVYTSHLTLLNLFNEAPEGL